MTSPYDKLPELERPQEIFDLKGKTVFLAGAAGGIGRRMALALAHAGARLALADLDQDGCQKLAASLKEKTGCRAIALGMDVSSEQSVADAVKAAHGEFGSLDGLVYNVMAKPEGYYRPFEEYPLETWQGVIQGNLTGAFLCCREAGRIMTAQGSGSVVLTASVYGVVAPDQRIYEGCTPDGNIYGHGDSLNAPAAYSASKGGLISLAKYLASLWGPKGVRVNLITPGGVYDGQEEAFHQAYIQRTPLGRMASFTDFNGALLFLLSPASRYVTGANLMVDGGWTAW